MNEIVLKSAIVIPVPEIETVVHRWRKQLDPSCARGLPAHVTLLFPFAHPSEIDEATIVELEDFFQQVEPFSFSFDALAWFDERVVYLAPNPDLQFRRLTAELLARFPSHQPYGGKFKEPTPHLTVGDGASAKLLKRAEKEVATKLPVTIRADEALLMTGGMTPNSWKVHTRFLFHTL